MITEDEAEDILHALGSDEYRWACERCPCKVWTDKECPERVQVLCFVCRYRDGRGRVAIPSDYQYATIGCTEQHYSEWQGVGWSYPSPGSVP
jgi:hypothetical protein